MRSFPLLWAVSAIVVAAAQAQCQEEVSMLQANPDPAIMSADVPRIAVYTENIGGYDDVRQDYIATVPKGVDAFYFLDEKGMMQNEAALKKWQEHGWKIQRFNQIQGTKYVNGPRLTGKKLKFAPPNFLANGKKYDWLIHHDANLRVNLDKLGPFLRSRNSKALVLLDYCYEYPRCCGTGRGMECFNHSTDFYIDEAPKLSPEKISTSLHKMKSWRDDVLEKISEKKLSMPQFYKLNIIMRNLRHPKAAEVREVFDQTFEKCHEMQRDQPILPVYLYEHNLSTEVGMVSFQQLVDVAQFRKISGHKFMDL